MKESFEMAKKGKCNMICVYNFNKRKNVRNVMQKNMVFC